MCDMTFFRRGDAYTEVNVTDKNLSEGDIQLILSELAFSKSDVHLIYIAYKSIGIVVVCRLHILRLI